MNKSIKLLSIISVIIAGVSILLACFSLTVFWKVLCVAWGASDIDVLIDIGPILPIGNTLYIIGCSIFALILIISFKSSNTIIIDIVSIIFLSIVLPILSFWLGIVQNHNVAFLGVSHSYVLTITNNVLVLPIGVMKLSSALNLVICGMRISKHITLKSVENNG